MSRTKTKYFGYPDVLTCSKTGKKVKANPVQIEKALLKSGVDIETYVANYVCREARKELKIKNSTSAPRRTSTKNFISQNSVRKDLIKEVWNKVCQEPPEFYQEKIKNSRRK